VWLGAKANVPNVREQEIFKNAQEFLFSFFFRCQVTAMLSAVAKLSADIPVFLLLSRWE